MDLADDPPPVVVGVDGTATALRAAVWGIAEARLRRSALCLIHVLAHSATRFARQRSTELLAHARSVLAGREPDVPLLVRQAHGDPTEVLVNAAGSAALLVVGRTSDRPDGLAHGSVANGLAVTAPGPVAVVRGHPRPHNARRAVLLGVHDVRTDADAIGFAFADADRHGTRLVAHTAPGSTEWQVEAALARWCAAYPGVPLDVRADGAPAIRALLRRARDARLVVVSTGVAGSVLVRTAPCPVVAVPGISIEPHPGARALTAAHTPGSGPDR